MWEIWKYANLKIWKWGNEASAIRSGISYHERCEWFHVYHLSFHGSSKRSMLWHDSLLLMIAWILLLSFLSFLFCPPIFGFAAIRLVVSSITNNRMSPALHCSWLIADSQLLTAFFWSEIYLFLVIWLLGSLTDICPLQFIFGRYSFHITIQLGLYFLSANAGRYYTICIER
jgi:hypothetical protein